MTPKELTALCWKMYNHDPRNYVDECGECNATALAEDAANYAGHDEWLDDETHEIWDAATDVALEVDRREQEQPQTREEWLHDHYDTMDEYLGLK